MDIRKSQQSAYDAYRAGNLQQAASLYTEILNVQPNDLNALFMIGLISAQTGNFRSAIGYFQAVIKINPSHTGAHYNLGNVYRDSGQVREAFQCYQKVLQYDPNHAEAFVNLGFIFRLMGRPDQELASYQKAIQINPNSAQAFFNLGHYFFEREQFDKAFACFEKVTALNPEYSHAYMNLGIVLRIMGRHEEALSCYQKVIELNPNDAAAHWNLSNVLLLAGNYQDGWKEFEWFRKTDDCSRRQRSFPQPLWDGYDIKGLTILLHAEEGFGDTIQFIRYAPLVEQLGAKVIVESQKELTSLLQNIDGIHQILSHGEPLPAFDIHCPLMSLPGIFSTTIENIPAETPYLAAENTLVMEWRTRFQNDTSRLKIGLIWSGGGLPLKKSSSLDMFSPLQHLENVTFYSIQKGPPAEQAQNPPQGMKLIDHSDLLNDFSDTAALIENLDLVISVDTAVAHLAGALGKPVWTLVPFVPDWRWLLHREDSPWYPSMRLFRQPALGDWKSVIAIISAELQERLAAGKK